MTAFAKQMTLTAMTLFFRSQTFNFEEKKIREIDVLIRLLEKQSSILLYLISRNFYYCKYLGLTSSKYILFQVCYFCPQKRVGQMVGVSKS